MTKLPLIIGAELARRGHTVTAVDLDPVLIEEARTRSNIEVIHADLATLTLAPSSFDVVVAAGNVMVFLEPSTEAGVLAAWHDALVPGGTVILGFATDRDYTVDMARRDLHDAGFTAVQQFATWSVGMWTDTADWAVLVGRQG